MIEANRISSNQRASSPWLEPGKRDCLASGRPFRRSFAPQEVKITRKSGATISVKSPGSASQGVGARSRGCGLDPDCQRCALASCPSGNQPRFPRCLVSLRSPAARRHVQHRLLSETVPHYRVGSRALRATTPCGAATFFLDLFPAAPLEAVGRLRRPLSACLHQHCGTRSRVEMNSLRSPLTSCDPAGLRRQP